jgi:hypothetical protein
MLEKTIEVNLCRSIEAMGGLALKFVSPGRVGVPDRIVLLPSGEMYFVELKAPGKKLSPKQAKMAKVLAGLGHPVRVIDSLEGIKEFIHEISSP